MIIVGVYTRFEPQYGTKQKLKRSRLWNLIMEIEVQFFALYRERAGCRRASLELPTGATVEDLTTEVRRRYPGLARAEVRIVVAVNTDEPAVATFETRDRAASRSRALLGNI